jgi:para-aminobenzoate synthetase component 1
MISNSVSVEKYRYIEKIKTHKGEILQTSSEIVGLLPDDWQSTFGESLLRLLPAGSISGAPKQKTCEIIRENELSPRGYYTGVFGIFDGASIDSAVAIRYIENQDGRYHFRSGGGITALSNVEDEYEELIQKIYVPLA